jgi:protein TonB
MFETSVVQARNQAAGGRLSLLTVSVIAHSAVILGAIAFSIASVDFPTAAPDAYEEAPVFIPVRIPPPLGDPNGGKPEQPAQQKAATPPPAPTQITAPSQVPENVVPLDTPSTAVAESDGPPAGTVPGPVGRPDGVKDSIGGLDGPPIVNAAPPVENRIYQSYEVKPPILLSKIDPAYPHIFVHAGIPSTVVLRCIIDRNGHVRDPEIVVSGRKPFDDAVIAAVQLWRYNPASLRGTAVDSYLDVTVHFTVRH